MNERVQQTRLPPNTQANIQRGYLKITPLALTFFQSHHQNTLLKITFWGSSTPNYLRVDTTETFPIYCPLNKFKLYLIDSKATQLEVVDSRNYKTICSAYLNWLRYLRSMDDHQLYQLPENDEEEEPASHIAYYLPFIDQEMEDTLPLYRNASVTKVKSNEKLGEIRIRWQCKIFDLQESKSPTPPQFDTEANFYNIRVGMAEAAKESQFVSIREIDMVREESRSNNLSAYERPFARNSKMTESNHSVYLGLDPRKMQGSPSYNEARHSNISKVSKISRGLREGDKPRGEINRRLDSNLQVELLRIRMQMAEYIPEKKTPQTERVARIAHLELASRHLNIKDLLFLDVVNEAKDTLKKKYRLFAESILQNKATFNSSLGVELESSLTFSLTFKKPKEFVAKAQLSVKDIGQGRDVNLFGNDGLLCGFLRVGIAFNTQVRHEAKSDENEKIKEALDKLRRQEEQSRIRQQQADLYQRRSVQRVDRKQATKQQPVKQHKPNVEMYFLVLLQEYPSSEPHSFIAFNRKMEGPAAHKFGIWPQSQLVGKPLSVSVLNSNELLLYQETVIEKIAQIPPNPINITCSLIFKKHLPHTKITCSLYAGSSDQLVFFMQELTQNILNQAAPFKPTPKREYTQEKSERLQSQGRQDTEQARRKLKTQEGLRLQHRQRMMTEDHQRQSNTVNQLDGGVARQQPQLAEEIQQESNQNFYLVDLLTRFLQELESRTLPDLKEIEKQHFLKILSADINRQSQLQLEVVDMIVNIFQDEAGSPLSLELLRQSLKAFTTFSNLYSQQKKQLLEQVCTLEPKALEKIKKHAEMGMINEKILWQQAWKKVSSSDLKHSLNKIYRISSYAPTEAILLIEDIQAIRTESKPKLRSVDICNLGVLIKEWVQNYLSQIPKDTMKTIRDKIVSLCEEDSMLNIRSTNQILQSEISLRLSLWQSLLLIEQVKSSYICDIDIGEGLITGDSFLAWIDSVFHRNQPDNDSVHTSKLSLQGLNQIEAWGRATHNNAYNETIEVRQTRHKGSDHIREHIDTAENRSPKSNIQSKYGNDSQLEYKNNDSEIVDIANLLRQREEEEQKKLNQRSSVVANDRKIEVGCQMQRRKENLSRIENKSRFIDDSIIQTRQKVGKKDSAAIKRPSFRLFYLQVQQLKIYEQAGQQPLLKLMVTLGQNDSELTNSSFIYLTSHNNYAEANLKSFEIKTSVYKNQIIQVKLRSERQVIGAAFLDWEEYIPWYKESAETYSKTLVIYGAKGAIIGKIRFLLNRTDPNQHKKEIEVQNLEKIRLKVTQGAFFESNAFYLTVCNDLNSLQPIQIQVGQQYALSLEKPIYTRELLLQNQTRDASCLILLEQLYLRQYVAAEYPLIDTTTGVFKGNVSIAMSVGALPLASAPLPTNQLLEENKRNEPSQQSRIRSEPSKNKIANPTHVIQELKSHQIIKQIDSIYDSLKNKFGRIHRKEVD